MIHSTQYLINEVAKLITEPYSDWTIGIHGNGRLNDEGCISTVVFNPNNNRAVIDAYNHFSGLGMTTKQAVPTETKYLFLFKNTWTKNLQVNF